MYSQGAPTIVSLMYCFFSTVSFFFFNDTATTEIYTLSLHDALPISWPWPFAGEFASGTRTGVIWPMEIDRKSTRLNSSHLGISYAVFCLKKKKGDPEAVIEAQPLMRTVERSGGGPAQMGAALQLPPY